MNLCQSQNKIQTVKKSIIAGSIIAGRLIQFGAISCFILFSLPLHSRSAIKVCDKLQLHINRTFPWSEKKHQFIIEKTELLALQCNFHSSLQSSTLMSLKKRYKKTRPDFTNFDLLLNFSGAEQFFALLPFDLKQQIFFWQRSIYRNYKRIFKILRNINPMPGYSYFGRIRSPAYPYVNIQTIDILSYDKRIFSYQDDLQFRITDTLKKSFGLGISYVIY